MGNLTRNKRLERIERDDGDDDDTVITSVHSCGRAGSYHDDPGCTNLPPEDRRREVTRKQAQLAIKYPCSVCVLGDYEATGGSENVFANALKSIDPDDDWQDSLREELA